MTTAAEYRDYAKECMKWASEAKTEEERKTFLAMAQQWVNAALVADGVASPSETAGLPPSLQRH